MGVDALQRQGTWFPNAYSTSSWTLPSVASLLVSQYPSRHGVVQWGAQLSSERVTMVELLRGAGYRTGAWIANIMLTRHAGFDQGFDVYHVRMGPDGQHVKGHSTTSFVAKDSISNSSIIRGTRSHPCSNTKENTV